MASQDDDMDLGLFQKVRRPPSAVARRRGPASVPFVNSDSGSATQSSLATTVQQSQPLNVSTTSPEPTSFGGRQSSHSGTSLGGYGGGTLVSQNQEENPSSQRVTGAGPSQTTASGMGLQSNATFVGSSNAAASARPSTSSTNPPKEDPLAFLSKTFATGSTSSATAPIAAITGPKTSHAGVGHKSEGQEWDLDLGLLPGDGLTPRHAAKQLPSSADATSSQNFTGNNSNAPTAAADQNREEVPSSGGGYTPMFGNGPRRPRKPFVPFASAASGAVQNQQMAGLYSPPASSTPPPAGAPILPSSPLQGPPSHHPPNALVLPTQPLPPPAQHPQPTDLGAFPVAAIAAPQSSPSPPPYSPVPQPQAPVAASFQFVGQPASFAVATAAAPMVAQSPPGSPPSPIPQPTLIPTQLDQGLFKGGGVLKVLQTRVAELEGVLSERDATLADLRVQLGQVDDLKKQVEDLNDKAKAMEADHESKINDIESENARREIEIREELAGDVMRRERDVGKREDAATKAEQHMETERQQIDKSLKDLGSKQAALESERNEFDRWRGMEKETLAHERRQLEMQKEAFKRESELERQKLAHERAELNEQAELVRKEESVLRSRAAEWKSKVDASKRNVAIEEQRCEQLKAEVEAARKALHKEQQQLDEQRAEVEKKAQDLLNKGQDVHDQSAEIAQAHEANLQLQQSLTLQQHKMASELSDLNARKLDLEDQKRAVEVALKGLSAERVRMAEEKAALLEERLKASQEAEQARRCQVELARFVAECGARGLHLPVSFRGNRPEVDVSKVDVSTAKHGKHTHDSISMSINAQIHDSVLRKKQHAFSADLKHVQEEILSIQSYIHSQNDFLSRLKNEETGKDVAAG